MSQLVYGMAGSRDNRIVARLLMDGVVLVNDLGSSGEPTILSSRIDVGNRMALSTDGSLLVGANYFGPVECWEWRAGRRLWQRLIKGVDRICASRDGSGLWVTRGSGWALLDLMTGEIRMSVARIGRGVINSWSNFAVVQRRGHLFLHRLENPRFDPIPLDNLASGDPDETVEADGRYIIQTFQGRILIVDCTAGNTLMRLESGPERAWRHLGPAFGCHYVTGIAVNGKTNTMEVCRIDVNSFHTETIETLPYEHVAWIDGGRLGVTETLRHINIVK